VTSTSLTVASPLAAGRYRVWIRAISEMGEKSAWSKPVDFTVASVRSNDIETAPASGPMTASTIASVALHNTYVVMPLEESDVRSVEVAPQSGVATNLLPAFVTELPVNAAQVDAVDSVMAEWAASDWWDGHSNVEQKQNELSQAAAVFGLGLAAGRNVIRTDRKKKNQ